MVRGLQKQCSQVSDMQIQKYKYTNTVWSNLQIDLTCAIFSKSRGCKDIKYDILSTTITTSTRSTMSTTITTSTTRTGQRQRQRQRQKNEKDSTCAIFSKSRRFEDIKSEIQSEIRSKILADLGTYWTKHFYHRFTRYSVDNCRDRRLRTFVKIPSEKFIT